MRLQTHLELDFGPCRLPRIVVLLQASFPSTRAIGALIRWINFDFRFIHRACRSAQQRFGPSAYGAYLGSAASGQKREGFKYKKGKPLKPLKLLDPKRQLRAVNRHDRSVYRQKLLALLTVNCHTSVCLVTELEIENDG
jgi:hypothetical protein